MHRCWKSITESADKSLQSQPQHNKRKNPNTEETKAEKLFSERNTEHQRSSIIIQFGKKRSTLCAEMWDTLSECQLRPHKIKNCFFLKTTMAYFYVIFVKSWLWLQQYCEIGIYIQSFEWM